MLKEFYLSTLITSKIMLFVTEVKRDVISEL
jgi:hypothetical protein